MQKGIAYSSVTGSQSAIRYQQDLDHHLIRKDLSIGLFLKVSTGADANDVIITHGHNTELEADNSVFYLNLAGSSGSWDITYIHEYDAGSNEATTFNTDLANDTFYYIGLSRSSAGGQYYLYIGDGYNLIFKGAGSFTNQPTGGEGANTELQLFQTGGATSASLDDYVCSEVIIAKECWTPQQHLQNMRRGSKGFISKKSTLSYYNPLESNLEPVLDFSGSANYGEIISNGSFLSAGPNAAVLQPSYKIRRRNIFSSIPAVNLSETVSSDLDSWADVGAVNLEDAGEITELVSDNLNNWAQAVSVEIPELDVSVSSDLDSWNDSSPTLLVSLLTTITDSLDFWDDSIHPVYSLGKSVNSTLTFSDAISILTLGFHTVDVSDDLDNWSENVELLNDLILKVNDTLDKYRDNVELLYVIRQELADNLNNWSDSASKTLLLELTRTVSSTLNSWDDNVVREFLTRLARNKHSLLTGYIRRYLNDPKEPITKDLRVEASDSNANNWQDSNA